MRTDSKGVGAVVGGVLALAVIATLALSGPDPRVVPVAPEAAFDPHLIETGHAYNEVKYLYWAVATILRYVALIGIVVMGGGAILSRIVGRWTTRPNLRVFGSMALLLSILALVTLPLAYASGYRIEQAFGLSTQSRWGWLLDFVRGRGFWIFVYSAAATGFLASIRRWPRRGWIVAAAGGVAIAIVGTALAPRLIDPLFHDFTPLADAELEADIVALGEEAGIDIQRVRVMDASRRTRRLNAYVTGLGATRQVVLYDNLIASAPREELLLVVAHEIGHQVHGHVWRGVLISVPALVLGVWALSLLARWQARRRNDLDGPGDAAGLPLLWLATSLALFLSTPVSSAISRSMEADADWVSLELTEDPDTFTAAKTRLAETNLTWIDPPGLIVRWFYSHPPVLERLGMAKHWRRARGDASS